MTNPIRQWWSTEGPNPFKPNQGTTLRSVVGLDAPHRARCDQMHIFAYGYGKDFAASSVVLCAKMKVWSGRGMGTRMETAFASFRQWCAKTKHSTSLTGFNQKVFKMGQPLDLLMHGCYHNPDKGSFFITKSSADISWFCQELEQISYGMWQSTWCYPGLSLARERAWERFSWPSGDVLWILVYFVSFCLSYTPLAPGPSSGT